ncbi:MAG TPA: hypothetical protein VMW16_08420 [Sedimentisphaerales bacterium]|nr:hypothetical protein [Sedimentisphaerales bacterium]
MKASILLILPALVLLCAVLGERAAAAEQDGQEHNHQGHFSLFSLVEPLGIATLSFVSATFATGLFRRRLGRRFLKVHLLLGIVSVILGFTHGVLVFLLFG